MNKLNFARVFNNAKRFTKKHSPEILTGIGIAGMITTTVLAVKATPKALKKIENYEETMLSDHQKAKPVEIVKITWKDYIPAAVTGACSIACLIGATSVSVKRHAALMTAYKISETALNEYREKVIDEIGKEKEKDIHEKVVKQQIEKQRESDPQPNLIVAGNGDQLCYDIHSQRIFKSTINKIEKAMNTLNYRMTVGSEMYVSLSDFYDEIGLSHTGSSDEMGWVVDRGMIDISFGSMIIDGVAYITIEHLMPPDYDYDRCY